MLRAVIGWLNIQQRAVLRAVIGWLNIQQRAVCCVLLLAG